MHLYPVKRGAAVRRFYRCLLSWRRQPCFFTVLVSCPVPRSRMQKLAVERAIRNPWSTATPSRGPIPGPRLS